MTLSIEPRPAFTPCWGMYASTINAGRPEDEALSALRIMAGALAGHSRLRALDLSDNALGEKGIRAFAAGLTNKVNPLRLCWWRTVTDGSLYYIVLSASRF